MVQLILLFFFINTSNFLFKIIIFSLVFVFQEIYVAIFIAT
nr:MAG TPA: hypothetical protein [Caudoviricetes sp.]